MAPVYRTTMFKVPDPDNQKKLIAAYHQLAKDQSKDGKPYLLGLHVGQAADDPRTKGYTVVVHTVFASKEDMVYYDEQCPAHGALKTAGRDNKWTTEMPLSVFFEGGDQVITQ